MPTALVFYHYFHPDDVVSAVHMAELCQELAERGWEITAMPCNRSCRDANRTYGAYENWRGIAIKRVWRPALRQASVFGHLFNSAWMISRWSLEALLSKNSPEILIVGTDPALSILAARVWKWLRPEVRIAHWCFDLYPEGAVANGLLPMTSPLLKLARTLLRPAYASCDLIADIGSCMRRKLKIYLSAARRTTLTPWALAEPVRPAPVRSMERQGIFGDSKLALLYSGNFGRAHCYEGILELASLIEPDGAKIAFSVRGNRVRELRQAARMHSNILFVPFASPANLERHLSAADIQVVSLREEWTGSVVPSKFFGSLAVGRPVIFVGSPESAIAQWIGEHGVGWVLTRRNIESVAAELKTLGASPEALSQMFRHCHDVYQQNFSKHRVVERWDYELRQLLGARVKAEAPAARAAGA